MELLYDKIILDIINSNSFKENLLKINNNYNNLKQENHIRNYILEEINEFLITNNYSSHRAFAEHPRVDGCRVDLSIVDKESPKNPYKIEFKYQFSGDNNNMSNYWKVIKKDFEFRSSDLFILIISNWNKKEKEIFDNQWGISSNLSRYISKNDKWKDNIRNSFNTIENTVLIETEKITLSFPFEIDYYFYILKNK
ncbi:hypothetical protein [Empedobacter falsenii]|uniref:Uncharacterized protein n=1 Tax=Empedobacter falsenii TaxID=343874 RepID=A0A3R8TJV9_9FLAO|nr:hypothetical protein [Empedobacter falsenii]RRT87927.1 hypothetical protein EGI88_12790 [Empedobacter falsenii]RRT88763.1 hypothetical protein EGI89_12800 [Empedobacter falsenii]HAD79809.1 hypothetical protein [Flavobacteriaceae bacterium]